MPPNRFHFERRKIDRFPSSEALLLPASLAPAPGYEIIPKPEARMLVAYLLSLNADAALWETPVTLASAPAPTNAPSATATNAASSATPNAPTAGTAVTNTPSPTAATNAPAPAPTNAAPTPDAAATNATPTNSP